MKKEIIGSIIKNFHLNPIPNFFKRDISFNFLKNIKKIYTIIGPRRAGKTFFCYQIISDLLKKGVKKENILYFYLENDELFPIYNDDLNLILEIFFEITKYNSKEKYYIFLDEIQEVKDWEKFIAKIFDQYKNIEIVLTGSSSSLLSKEISTILRGKSLSLEILPLTLKEKNLFKQKTYKKFLSTEEKILYKEEFKNTLDFGLFPEIVLENDKLFKYRNLKDYFDLIFYKDIIERYNLKSLRKLKIFRKLLISYLSQIISYNKLSKEVGVEYNTIINWVQYFIDSYFLFELKNFSFSVGKIEGSLSKIYILDNGFYYINFAHYKEDYGNKFENFIFLELRKKGFMENENIFYFKDKTFDIDFILFENGKISPIQVCYELNENNFEREYKKFDKFLQKFGIKKGYLVIFENNFKGKLFSDLIEVGKIEEFEMKF